MDTGIKNLATKDDIALVKYELRDALGNSIKWMFIFG